MRRKQPIRVLAVVSTTLCLTCSAMAASLKLVKSAAADLNGDGVKEQIVLKPTKDHGSNLYIGNLKANTDEVDSDGFAVVDIDAADKFKEVALQYHDAGEPGYGYLLLSYDGRSVKQLADLGWGPEFVGGGIVLKDSWNGYATVRDKYLLNNRTRTLDLVPQPMQWIGQSHKVINSFPIYLERGGKKIVANVAKGSTVMIVAYAPLPTKEGEDVDNDWYLVKTQSNLLGWANIGSISQNVEGMGGAG